MDIAMNASLIEGILRSVEAEHDVYHILTCFREMGASAHDIAHECERLLADKDYRKVWCKMTGFIGNYRHYN